MSQIDDNLKREVKGTKLLGRDSVLSFNDQMAAPIGSVTSRDQIIDPYALVNPANYRKSRTGQAQYNSDLLQAQQYAERQEAAYQEWYNSPEQQAIRDREAGLNPDLVGLSGSEAADTEQNPNSPIAGQQTNGQLAIESINLVMSVVQTAASVATLAQGIPNIGKQGKLLDSQIDAQNIANVNSFEQIAHNAIASKFATFHAAETAAGRAVDVAKYFADDANFADILPSYAPSDSPMYQHALARVRKGSESVLASAYGTNADAAQNQQSFARLLANPYANSNTVVMSAILEPLMSAVFQMESYEAQYRSDAAKFKSDAMSGIDATETGEVWLDSQKQELRSKEFFNIIESAKAQVYQNLKDTYLKERYSPAGQTAQMLILGHYQSTLEGLLVNYITQLLSQDNVSKFGDLIDEVGTMDLDGDPVTNEGFNGFKMGRPTK